MKYWILVIGIALALVVSISGAQEERYVGITYPDQASTDFLKRVLAELSIPYTVELRKNGVQVQWASTNPMQEQEIQNRVSQFSFLKDVCESRSLPEPSEPAKKGLSCE